jgi:hypothetical protein
MSRQRVTAVVVTDDYRARAGPTFRARTSSPRRSEKSPESG